MMDDPPEASPQGSPSFTRRLRTRVRYPVYEAATELIHVQQRDGGAIHEIAGIGDL